MSKDAPLGKLWAELWNERQHLIGLPITHLEIGVRIDWNNHLQVFITWLQGGKFCRVEERYTRLDMQQYADDTLSVTTAVRTLTKAMQEKVTKLETDAYARSQTRAECGQEN